jgi:hypothetical protein
MKYKNPGATHRWPALAVKATRDLIVVVLFLYGYVYTAYKYGNPLFGRNDFFEYQEMVRHPFSFSVTVAPFVLRQIPTIVAAIFYNMGAHYDTGTVIDLIGVDQETKRRFFALILSSGIAVCLSFTILAGYLRTKCSKFGLIELFSLFGILAAWFFFPSGIISPLTYAWGWLASSLFVIAFLERKLVLTCAACLLALFSRETTVVFAIVLFSARLLVEESHRSADVKSIFVMAASGLGYLLIRVGFTSGNEHQIDPYSLLEALLSFNPSRDYIFQSFLSQGLLVLLLVSTAVKRPWEAVYLSLAVVAITVLGIATNESGLALLYGETLPFYAIIFYLAWSGDLQERGPPAIAVPQDQQGAEGLGNQHRGSNGQVRFPDRSEV